MNSQCCTETGCYEDAVARLCSQHYARLRKYSDPQGVETRGRKPKLRELPDEQSPTKLGALLGVSKQRAHQILNANKHAARNAVAAAVKSGAITVPTACQRCGAKHRKLEAHHDDY